MNLAQGRAGEKKIGEKSMLGTVKFFNSVKGWGFITDNEKFEDYFFHHSSIVMDGYKSLADGQKVSFDPEKDEKGLRAKNIRKIE